MSAPDITPQSGPETVPESAGFAYYRNVTPPEPRHWFVLFGIVDCVLGALLLLLLGLTTFILVLSASIAPNGTTRPPSMAGMMRGAEVSIWLAYGLAAAFFFAMGYGTFRPRRWARALMVIASSLWLIVGLLGTVGIMFIVPKILGATQGSAGSGGSAVAVGVGLLMAFGIAVLLLILPPVGLLAFYGRKDVKASFDRQDPVARWTDACPVPVLAVSVALAYQGITSSAVAFSGIMPVFGRVARGVGGYLLGVFVLILCGVLAWANFRLRRWSWIGTVALLLVWTTSNLFTYTTHSLTGILAQQGFSPQPATSGLGPQNFVGGWLLVWTGAIGVLCLGYLIYIRRFFFTAVAPE